uniref:Uncharacterized protein n=1 Tax=Arundo donax TaxID=35708 RepID=A0A0A9FHW4_ARUDO
MYFQSRGCMELGRCPECRSAQWWSETILW